MTSGSMGKVFIFNYFDCIPTDGGPSGVLGQCLIGHTGEFFFVNPVSPLDLNSLERIKKIFTGRKLPSFFQNFRVRCLQIFKRFRVEDYPIIYFHDIYSLVSILDVIAPDQTVVLQSHSPELPHEEFAKLSYANEELVEWIAESEKKAFSRADCLVFPNDGVLEIYEPLMGDKHSVHYLETGARAPSQLQSIPLDNNKIHLLYIGRRNSIKGFDIVLQAFGKAREKHPELSLILVGNGELVKAEGVTDIGFSCRPHDWINSCDFVINCNRQSYFDLSAIETLSVGTPFIVSENFGHKIFSSFPQSGIIPIGPPCVNNLQKVLDPALLRKFMLSSFRRQNRSLYEQRFSDSVYRENLDKLCRELLVWHDEKG